MIESRVGQKYEQAERCSGERNGRRGAKEDAPPQVDDGRVLRSESHSGQVGTARRRKDAPKKRHERMGDKGDQPIE